jgi:hypothetical protein
MMNRVRARMLAVTGGLEATTSRPRRRAVLIGLTCAAVVLSVGVGVLVGARSPWGVKSPHVAHGVAMRANNENDLVMFDADDGSQIDFGADHIWWESQSTEGEGNPPCLRTPQRKVNVDVGYMRVAGPDGGWFTKAVWVRCP